MNYFLILSYRWLSYTHTQISEDLGEAMVGLTM